MLGRKSLSKLRSAQNARKMNVSRKHALIILKAKDQFEVEAVGQSLFPFIPILICILSSVVSKHVAQHNIKTNTYKNKNDKEKD